MNTPSLKRTVFVFMRNGLYAVARLLNYILPTPSPRVVVYGYHSISNDGWRFSVTEENFKQQIEFLLQTHTPLAVRDLPAYLSGDITPTRDAFIVTFDDGYLDILSVREFLKQKHISPTIFMLSNTTAPNYTELGMKRPFLSPEQIIALQNEGWEIGSHSATHADFTSLTPTMLAYETKGSREELETIVGHTVVGFSYPKGIHNREIVQAAVDGGFSLGFTIDDEYLTPHTNPMLIPRIGVDGTHALTQFALLASPGALLLRKMVKKLLHLV